VVQVLNRRGWSFADKSSVQDRNIALAMQAVVEEMRAEEAASKRSEELLGTDGDVAAMRVLLSDGAPEEKQAELERLAGVFAKAVRS
jgi:hypothetical protein